MSYQLAFPLSHLEPPQPPLLRGEQLENGCQTQTQLVSVTDELPLLDLFTRLREAGLPLGIGEYQLLLRALQGGFGVADEAALKRLCQALWVKSAEDNRLFEYHFKQVMAQVAVSNWTLANLRIELVRSPNFLPMLGQATL